MYMSVFSVINRKIKIYYLNKQTLNGIEQFSNFILTVMGVMVLAKVLLQA